MFVFFLAATRDDEDDDRTEEVANILPSERWFIRRCSHPHAYRSVRGKNQGLARTYNSRLTLDSFTGMSRQTLGVSC